MIYYVTYLLNGSFQLDTCWDMKEVGQALNDVAHFVSDGYNISSLTIKSYKLFRS